MSKIKLKRRLSIIIFLIFIILYLIALITIRKQQTLEKVYLSIFCPITILSEEETIERDPYTGLTKTSWYGPGFDGNISASGEIFSQDSLTAASPNLPFNTIVEITNLENNKSVIVRINDRGPFAVDPSGQAIFPLKPHPIRAFDLSKQAFESISPVEKGVIKVKYKILR